MVGFTQISQHTNPVSFDFLNELPELKESIEFSKVDHDALRAQDALLDKAFDNRFAFGHEVDLTLNNAGQWDDLPNGDKIWRLKIKSKGAFSLNTVFKHYELPKGASVHIYSVKEKHVIGGFTSRNNKENHVLATVPVPGDEVIIEYFEPSEVAGQGILEIMRIGHDYKNIFNITQEKGFNTSGACNNNVVCPEGAAWSDQANAVAMSMIGGTRWCSGTMVANTSNDSIPYYLTADHCIDGANPSTWLFVFNYKSSTCSPATDASLGESVSNSTLRSNRPATDVALLELSSLPPYSYNVFYAGWDKTDAIPARQTGIHHPDGDVMKISFDTNPATKVQNNSVGSNTVSCWEIGEWEDGTTEGGSSGSGLFDQNQRIIGQLYGGAASCSNTNGFDVYGRFGVSWDGTSANQRLHDWLDPTGTDNDTQDGYYLNAVTSISENELNSIEFNVFPNPSTGLFNIQSEELINSVEVFDISGKVILTKNSNGISSIDLNQFNTGFYFVKVNGSSIKKIQLLK